MTLGVQISIDFVRTHVATQTWMVSCLGSSILYAHLLSLRALILCRVSVNGNLICQVVADLGVLNFMQAELGRLDSVAGTLDSLRSLIP